jgi:hypothetical protein
VGIEWAIQQSLELKQQEFLFYIIILWVNQRIKIARMVLVDDLNSLTITINTVSGLGSIFILEKILKVYI